MPEITVAIVTGRSFEDTAYQRWMDIRRAFLDRDLRSENIDVEAGALLAAVLDDHLENHVEYQLSALDKGTRKPDRVIVVDRSRDDISGAEYIDSYGSGCIGIMVEPMISTCELERLPESALCCALSRRSNKLPMACSDKNTAIALCETDYLLILDDCCLPGFGLVQAAFKACEKGHILLIGHQRLRASEKLYWADTEIEVIRENWSEEEAVYTAQESKDMRRSFSMWAMPLSYALAVNGYNTNLDGDLLQGGLELLERLDRYASATELKYAVDPRARVYELGDHTYPWACKAGVANLDLWRDRLPSGWGFKAPGMLLKEIREAAGIRVGGDIFDLEGHGEHLEQSEHLEEIIEDVLSDDEDDE